MGLKRLNEVSIELLNELADLQHPHLKGDNHTRKIINAVYNDEPMSAEDLFDAGKYYQRMLEQLDTDVKGRKENFLSAILGFKWAAITHKNIKNA